MVRLETLVNSRHRPIAETAAKIRQEERYHLRHTAAWVRRLGLGTQESHRRMQAALEMLFPYAEQLFQPQDGQAGLVDQGYIPSEQATVADWRGRVRQDLEGASLRLPKAAESPAASRAEHSEHLAQLLSEMQVVARSDRDAAW